MDAFALVFDLEIHDRSKAENLVANHLSRIKRPSSNPFHVANVFPDEHLFNIHDIVPCFAEIVNYLVVSILPAHFTRAQVNKLMSESRYYV